MRAVRSYKILEECSEGELQEEVNKSIQKGFVPLGGVAVTVLHQEFEYSDSQTFYYYTQAMVDYHED